MQHFLYNKNGKTRTANTFQQRERIRIYQRLQSISGFGRPRGRWGSRTRACTPWGRAPWPRGWKTGGRWSWVEVVVLKGNTIISPGEHCRVRTFACGHTEASCTDKDMPDEGIFESVEERTVHLPVFRCVDHERAPAVPLACWLHSKRTLENKQFFIWNIKLLKFDNKVWGFTLKVQIMRSVIGKGEYSMQRSWRRNS